MNDNDAITIGMPVFNDIAFIEEAIQSIRSQTYSNFKLIISDDGSSDGSADVCLRYEQIDERIQYIRQPINLGISKNMQFLLAQAKTEFFMWAADDDLWHEKFIEKLVGALKSDKSAVCSFGAFAVIDEDSKFIRQNIKHDYSGKNSISRLKKYISDPNDSFGYGLFRTEKIRGVYFPVWWWPNHKCAYNNIYPVLCFYLSRGQYVHVDGESLFWNRLKNSDSINHSLPYPENSLKETLAFIFRKFNLVWISLKLITKGSNIGISFRIFPRLFFLWFIQPSFFKLKHYLKLKLTSNKV